MSKSQKKKTRKRKQLPTSSELPSNPKSNEIDTQFQYSVLYGKSSWTPTKIQKAANQIAKSPRLWNGSELSQNLKPRSNSKRKQVFHLIWFFWQSWLLSRRLALQRCLLQSSPGKCRNCAWNRPMGWPSSPYGSRRRAQIMKPKWAWGNSVGHVRPGNMRALPDDMAGRPLRVLTSPKDTVASNHRRGRAWVGSIYCDVLRFSWLFRDICFAPTICFFVWYHFLPTNFAVVPLLGASNSR